MSTPQNLPPDRRPGGAVFFLSYARTPVFDLQGEQDPDYWVSRFYEDLSQAVLELLAIEPGSAPGFMDLKLTLGEDWRRSISGALATCQAFVALYSPRYFATEYCGKEWAAVEDRITADRAAERPPTVRILPVVWAPVRPENLPAVARDIQAFAYAQSPAYRDFGVSGLIRLARWRNDYQRFIRLLAKQVATAATSSAPGPGEVRDYSRLRNAFEDEGATSSMPQLRITVVAPDSGRLPLGRDPIYYGPRARDWRPFAPAATRTLAAACVDLTTSLGFKPVVEDWRTSRLGTSAAPQSPGLLLVDPWVVRSDAEAGPWLERFDASRHESTSVIVATNPDDRQSAAAGAELDSALSRALGRRLSAGGLREHSVARIDSLDQLGHTLPTVTSAAAKQFLRLAKAYPPKGDPVAKPRLRGSAMKPPADGGPQSEGSAG